MLPHQKYFFLTPHLIKNFAFLVVNEVDKLPKHLERLDDSNLIQLKLLERYLRILEQCTHECTRNQAYLITFNDSSILKAVVR